MKFASKFITGAIICALVSFLRREYGVWFALCDGAFVAAIMLFCAGIFSAITKAGAFSAISYSMKILGARFKRRQNTDAQNNTDSAGQGASEKSETYFDYVRKNSKERNRRDARQKKAFSANIFGLRLSESTYYFFSAVFFLIIACVSLGKIYHT